MNRFLSLRCAAGWLLVSVMAAAGQASADVKVVFEVSVTGTIPVSLVANAPSGNSDALADPLRPDAVYTTYYKGGKARRESVGGAVVVIYDTDVDKVYTINVAAKKYFVVPFKKALENGSGLPGAIAETMNLITDVDLDKVAGASDANRTVAGMNAGKLTLFGSVAAGPKSANSPGFAPAGGQFGHGATGTASSGGDQSGGEPLPVLGRSTLNGGLWVTDAASVLPERKKPEAELLMAVLQQTIPFGCPILKALANDVAKKKVFPLASKIIVRSYPPSAGGASASDPNGSGFSLASADSSKSMTIVTEVKSVDTGVSLDESLFQLPTGLEKVNPPSPITPLPLQDVEAVP